MNFLPQTWSGYLKKDGGRQEEERDNISWPSLGEKAPLEYQNEEKVTSLTLKLEDLEMETVIESLERDPVRLDGKQDSESDEERDESSEPSKVTEEIRAERRLRRRQVKQLKRDEKVLAERRESKYKQVKLIRQSDLEKYKDCLKDQSDRERPTWFSRGSKDATFSLEAFMAEKPKILTCPKVTTNIPGEIVRHRGKKHEFPKPKARTMAKRRILEIRQEKSREEAKTMAKNMTNNPHSRRYREYCDHFTEEDLCSRVESILQDLFRFQDLAFHRSEIKARAKRRYVVGFKEANRMLDINKVKLLIVATDLERSPGEGGLDEAVYALRKRVREAIVPYVFALTRRAIGNILQKSPAVSCVAVLDYSGAKEKVDELLQVVDQKRSMYNELCAEWGTIDSLISIN
uniref:Ribosomal protein eL8/eL30/eS12/Gadd45 domain-containing protein n=1 Tax=Phlebotomus papatasi TaxID=29031 RepID=A0A1B0DF05_PHLPP